MVLFNTSTDTVWEREREGERRTLTAHFFGNLVFHIEKSLVSAVCCFFFLFDVMKVFLHFSAVDVHVFAEQLPGFVSYTFSSTRRQLFRFAILILGGMAGVGV